MKNLTAKILLAIAFFLLTNYSFAQNRWSINENSIVWQPEQSSPHHDHIEMSGESISAVLRYGVNLKGAFQLERSLIWPMLRTIPNNTHASLMQRFAVDIPSMLIVNGLALKNENVQTISLDGKLTVISTFGADADHTGAGKQKPHQLVAQLQRTLFPSTKLPVFCEQYTLKNISNKEITALVPRYSSDYKTNPSKGVEGAYTMTINIENPGTYYLNPGDSVSFGVYFQAFTNTVKTVSVANELLARNAFIQEMWSTLQFESPNSTINRMFAFSKTRTAESIFRTQGGLMHGPGGESYYAAIWANDQAEYVNPFFPYLGYTTGNESAINSFRHFARFMNPEFKALPSSIIAEGKDIWAGAKDRGDAAMIAYGAARFALAYGDNKEAQNLWPLIEWCLTYCDKQKNTEGVIASDSDELEGRFPAGKANLSTSSLYYDALISAAYLAKELKLPQTQINKYNKQAADLRKHIESYFGAEVEGYATYQYYKGNDILRSWICIPLTVGIFDRKDATIEALFSSRLWTKDGLLTQAGSETFWDRSTLYALRGVLEAGETAKALEYLDHYSNQRLLGNHVPYAIEAWPEGSQRHLSAESGLYCRIITEGLFGIRPTGLRSFTITPQLPEKWDQMQLKNIKAFGSNIDILINRQGNKIKISIQQNGKIIQSTLNAAGKTITVKL